MIVLDTTLRKLEIVLAGAVTTNQLPFVASYQDSTIAPPATNQGQSNSTTAVTAVAAPASGVQRRLKYFSIYNADTVAATVTVQLNDNGTLRTIVKNKLASGASLIFVHGAGWSVIPNVSVAPTFLGVVEIDQPANNADSLIFHRFTDTAPTGNFIACYTTGFGLLFNVDVNGNLSAAGTGSFGRLGIGNAADPNHLLLIDGGTITTDKHLLDSLVTWNNSGTTFTAIKLNVTNTASAVSSKLMDLQIGGSSLFRVSTDFGGVVYTSGILVADGGFNVNLSGQVANVGAGGPIFVFRGSRGTFVSPTASSLNDIIMNLYATAHDGSAYSRAGALVFNAAEAQTTSAHGMYLDIFTTPIGSLTIARALRIQASGGVSIGLTTDFGAGNLAVLGTISMGSKVAIYNNITTVSNGIPSEVATVDLTAQVAAVGATTLYTPVATGMFRISVALKLTTIGTSPVVGPITITYTDGDGSVAQSIVMALHSTTGTVVTTTVNNSTTTSTVNGVIVIYAKTGVAIQYAIAQSGTIGAGQWSAHLKCEAL